MPLRSVYVDRGFGTSTADAALAHHRIRDPVIPRQQRAAPIAQTRSWRRRYRLRNGLEGRISQLNAKASTPTGSNPQAIERHDRLGGLIHECQRAAA
jgi:hypothetical protein